MRKLVTVMCCIGILAILITGCGSNKKEVDAFISAASENGYALKPIDETESDDSLIVMCEVENSNDEFDVAYWTKDGHLEGIFVNAKTQAAISSDNFKKCIAAMAKSFDKEIDLETFTEDINYTINNPNETNISEGIMIRFKDNRFTLFKSSETN